MLLLGFMPFFSCYSPGFSGQPIGSYPVDNRRKHQSDRLCISRKAHQGRNHWRTPIGKTQRSYTAIQGKPLRPLRHNPHSF
jgi:hypothetical protein